MPVLETIAANSTQIIGKVTSSPPASLLSSAVDTIVTPERICALRSIRPGLASVTMIAAGRALLIPFDVPSAAVILFEATATLLMVSVAAGTRTIVRYAKSKDPASTSATVVDTNEVADSLATNSASMMTAFAGLPMFADMYLGGLVSSLVVLGAVYALSIGRQVEETMYAYDVEYVDCDGETHRCVAYSSSWLSDGETVEVVVCEIGGGNVNLLLPVRKRGIGMIVDALRDDLDDGEDSGKR